MIWRVGLSVLLHVACGGQPSAPREGTPRSDASSRSRPAAAHAAPPTRSLPLVGTYGDIVDRARALDDASLSDASDGCLLDAQTRPVAFRADIHVGVRPLPAAPADLDAMFASGSPLIDVMTPWGVMGDVAAGGSVRAPLTLVTFTTFHARRERYVIAALTDRGLRLHAVGTPEFRDAARPRAIETAAAEIRESSALTGGPVFFVAETGVAIDTVVAALRALEGSGAEPIVLATALPPGTRLPDAPNQDASVSMCPNGAPPEIPEGADESDGGLRLNGSENPFRARVRACLERARSIQGETRVELAFRISPTGEVDTACILRDSTQDAELHACIVAAARALRFSPPTPAGYAVVVYPFLLAPQFDTQRALCDAAAPTPRSSP